MICCVTGHRPKKFPFQRNDYSPEYNEYQVRLYTELDFLVKEGYTNFISGMAEGADMDFSEAVIEEQKDYKYEGYNITLEAALPCPIKLPKNPSNLYYERDYLLKACNNITIVSPTYHKGCMQKRNRYMVDSSDMVLAIWNGERSGGTYDTIKYAQKKGKPIRYIMLNKILDLYN